MHYRKILWGAVLLFGSSAAVFLWYSLFPTAAENFLDSTRGAVAQTWDDVSHLGGGQNRQDEMVVNDASPDFTRENATSVHDAAVFPKEVSSGETKRAIVGHSSMIGESDGNASSDPGAVAPLEIQLPSTVSTATPPSALFSDDENFEDTVAVPTAVPSPPLAASSCSFSFPSASAGSSSMSSALSRKIIFNEIAWMGSPSASNGEWMEIKNDSGSDIDLSGWEILNASGKIKILFNAGDDIPAKGLLLLARASTTFVNGNVAQKTYSGDLRNTGDDLALIDASCGVSDLLEASSPGWPAGNNATKQTMERDADGLGWHTSVSPGGTPGQENSISPPAVSYKVIVSFEGSGSASVVGNPSGMVCAAECVGSYISGTKIKLTVVPATSTAFVGWSGMCYGQTQCAFTLAGNVDVAAQIRSTLVLPAVTSVDGETMDSVVVASSTSDASDTTEEASSTAPSLITVDPNSSPTSTADQMTASSSSPPGHLLIAAVQIAGATASDDLVKIYDPTGDPVDMGGWKLRKRSSSGADYSIREFPAGTIISPQHYFVWANSVDGFAATVGADTSSTQTLAQDNSVAFIDASGAIVDAVAWGTGTGQYGEGSPYPTDPGPGQMLVRQSAGGTMIDTDNNANDFTLQ